MFLVMIVFLVYESDGFIVGMGVNIFGKKRSELKVRDIWVIYKLVKILVFFDDWLIFILFMLFFFIFDLDRFFFLDYIERFY